MKFVTKRAAKRIAIGLGLLIGLPLLVNGFLAWQAQRRFDSMVAEIKAAGDPVSIFDLAPKQIPQGANAATYIDRIAPQFREFEKKRDALYKTPLGEQLDASEQENKAPSAEQLAAIQAILDAFPTFLAALKDAAECTEYESLLNYECRRASFWMRL